MDEVKICELPYRSNISRTDKVVVETDDGTQLADVTTFKSLLDTSTTFDTVYDMRDEELEEGITCVTLGYRTKGDGGAARYIIVYDPTLKPNGADVVKLNTSDTLRAVFVSLTGTVTPEQFGAKGDGSKDDSAALQACIDSGYKILFKPGAKYCVYTSLKVPPHTHLDLNGSTILPVVCDAFVLYDDGLEGSITIMDEKVGDIHITNFNVDSIDGFAAVDFSSRRLSDLSIDNFNILNVNTHGIKVSFVDKLTVNNGSFTGNPDSDTVAIYTDTSVYDHIDTTVTDQSNLVANISASDILMNNVGTLIQDENNSSDYDSIRLNRVNYYADSILDHSCLIKSTLEAAKIMASISDAFVKNITSLVTSKASGVCVLNNIQGENVTTKYTANNATVKSSDSVIV